MDALVLLGHILEGPRAEVFGLKLVRQRGQHPIIFMSILWRHRLTSGSVQSSLFF